MTPYLLSAQTVLDIIKRLDLPAERWLASVGEKHVFEDDICISCVVPMTIMHSIDLWIAQARAARDPQLPSLGLLKKNAQIYLASFMQNERVIPMDEKIAERWGELLDVDINFLDEDGTDFAVGASEKVELATASIGRQGVPFIYVDRRQEAHASVPGLVIECPVEYVTAHGG